MIRPKMNPWVVQSGFNAQFWVGSSNENVFMVVAGRARERKVVKFVRAAKGNWQNVVNHKIIA